MSLHGAPSNIRIELRLGEILLVMDENGLIEGTFDVGNAIALTAVVTEGPACGFTVDKDKNATLRPAKGRAAPRYTQRVPLLVGRLGLYTHSATNHLRLAEVREGGELVLHQYAVVVQAGQVFVAYSNRTGQYYRYPDGSVNAPAFDTPDGPWFSMLQVVAEAGLIPRDLLLPPSSEYDPSEPDEPALDIGEARVMWYNPAQGWGLARIYAGQVAAVHASELALLREGELAQPQPGDMLGFTGVSQPEGAAFPRLIHTFPLASARV